MNPFHEVVNHILTPESQSLSDQAAPHPHSTRRSSGWWYRLVHHESPGEVPDWWRVSLFGAHKRDSGEHH